MQQEPDSANSSDAARPPSERNNSVDERSSELIDEPADSRSGSRQSENHADAQQQQQQHLIDLNDLSEQPTDHKGSLDNTTSDFLRETVDVRFYPISSLLDANVQHRHLLADPSDLLGSMTEQFQAVDQVLDKLNQETLILLSLPRAESLRCGFQCLRSFNKVSNNTLLKMDRIRISDDVQEARQRDDLARKAQEALNYVHGLVVNAIKEQLLLTSSGDHSSRLAPVDTSLTDSKRPPLLKGKKSPFVNDFF
jgi:hypothetical protein